MTKTTYTALTVAKYFLATGDMYDAPVTNLKLQKLLYYAQGFHLALFNTPLFEEKIQAWPHGPVVTEVYHEHKRHGSSHITPPTEEEFSWDDVDDDTEDFLDDIWDEFAKYSAWKLRDMTHAETPWKRAHESGDSTIPIASMRKYFRTRI